MTASATKSKKSPSNGGPITTAEHNAVRRAKKAKQRQNARGRSEHNNLLQGIQQDAMDLRLSRMRIILEHYMTSPAPTLRAMLEQAGKAYLQTYEETRGGSFARNSTAMEEALSFVKGSGPLQRYAEDIIRGAYQRTRPE